MVSLLIVNLIIACCYFTIAYLVGRNLWQVHVDGRNALGLATFGIFLTCGLGHSVHVLNYLAMSIPTSSALGQWICMLTGLPGVPSGIDAASIWASHIEAPPHNGYVAFQLGYPHSAMNT